MLSALRPRMPTTGFHYPGIPSPLRPYTQQHNYFQAAVAGTAPPQFAILEEINNESFRKILHGRNEI